MEENRKLYIFGASGHGRAVTELVSNAEGAIVAVIDDAPMSEDLGGIPIMNASEIVNPSPDLALIIAIGNNLTRKKISQRLKDYHFFSCVHKMAFVSPSATIGLGTVIMLRSIVNTNAKIGNHVIINTAAVIEHDCIIQDFAHISPNVTLSGNVKIGKGSHIGTGAIVIPGVKIGNWCTIGAGTVVIHDVPDRATVVGNPGKIIKYNPFEEISGKNETILKKNKVIKINSGGDKLKTY